MMGLTAMKHAMIGWALGLACVVMAPTMAAAQASPFAAAMVVNDRVVSNYEVSQRILFMTLLRQPGDIQAMAMESLIEDRLRLSAAKALGLTSNPDELTAAMGDFAGRANLTAEQFVTALGKGGVERQAFRDFVEANLLWRSVIRTKYGASVTITEAEIDRAIASGASAGGEIKVLLSEIVIPTNANATEALALANKLRAELKSETSFAAAAHLYSKSPTAAKGGRLEWTPVSTLPPGVAARVTALKKGETSVPIQVPGSVMLFYLRDIAQTAGDGTQVKMIDYAAFALAEGQDPASIRARVDRCDDLYALARGLPADRLTRETVAEAQMPAAYAGAMAHLDPGETVMVGSSFLMLCSRNPQSDVPPSRDDVRALLTNQRLGQLAENYLEELRSEAIIRVP